MTSPYCTSLFQEKPRHSSTQLPNSFRIQFDNTIFPTLFTNTSVAIYLILSIFKKLMVTTNKHSKLVGRSFRFWFFSVIFLIAQKQPSRHLPAQHHWRRSGTFIVNFAHIWQLVLVFLLLTFSVFLKNRPKKLFGNCLVDGLLTSIV